MKIFNLSKDYSVVCEWKKTRNAFKHVATITQKGQEVYSTKICYLNRTWEKYTFQSVLQKAIENYFSGQLQEKFLKIAENDQGEDQHFKNVAAICALGEILHEKPEEKAAFKKRIIGTVPGINFPDDFDKLSAEEKNKRLDGALSVLK